MERLRAHAGTLMKIIVVVAIVAIPVFYSYFYLHAFWDPYSRLQTVPVAVVNLDEGAVVNGQQRNLGDEMCGRMKENDMLQFTFTSQADAQEGTAGTKYYAMITIPADFSKCIAGASTTQKQVAKITYSPNEKRNYLAGQILGKAMDLVEMQVRSSINGEITGQLADQLKGAPKQLAVLQDGLGQLYSGSLRLTDGTAALRDGGTQLQGGVRSLDTGLQQLLDGINEMEGSTRDLPKLTQGASALADGAGTLRDSLQEYTAGVDKLVGSVESASSFLDFYTTLNPSLKGDPIFMAFYKQMTNPSTVSDLARLKAANSQVKDGVSQIADGAAQLRDGAANLPLLREAIGQLQQGITQARDGSAQLLDAAGQIRSGASALDSGAAELRDGLFTAKDGLDASLAEMGGKLQVLDGLPEFAANPVSVETDSVYPVANYGTAFAPYFLSLSLWVGGLMMLFGIYLDMDRKFKLLSRDSNKPGRRMACFFGIGLAQALVLGGLIKWGLGLPVNNIPLYFFACILGSFVFLSILLFLLVYLKDVGKFLAVLLLILQLTSCAGTFPLETAPRFFQVLYPYMPMTYTVGLFKEAISGVDTGLSAYNIAILCAILLVFLLLNLVLYPVQKKFKKKKAALQAA